MQVTELWKKYVHKVPGIALTKAEVGLDLIQGRELMDL